VLKAKDMAFKTKAKAKDLQKSKAKDFVIKAKIKTTVLCSRSALEDEAKSSRTQH